MKKGSYLSNTELGYLFLKALVKKIGLQDENDINFALFEIMESGFGKLISIIIQYCKLA